MCEIVVCICRHVLIGQCLEVVYEGIQGDIERPVDSHTVREVDRQSNQLIASPCPNVQSELLFLVALVP